MINKDVARLIGRLEGCACVARSDAQTLLVGCERKGYFADVARYNKENIEELCVLVRYLYEALQVEDNMRLDAEYIPF